MPAGEDLVARVNDEPVALILEPLAVVVRDGGGLFKMAYAVIISRGMRSFPMLKCSSDRWV